MTCENCQSYKVENGQHKVTCKLEGDTFNVHETNAERFQCLDYREHEPEPEPPKDNVMIVLSCGRDFLLHDERFYNEKELMDSFEGDGFIKYGQIWFKMSDIVAISYIGD